MKQYAKNLIEVMKNAKRGFPKYLDLSDQLHRDLVSGYFGGEEVMQEQYPLLYKSYSKAVEQGLGEVSYEGFCDNVLIYDSKYDFDTKRIIADGRVSLTEMAKTVFVSLNILKDDTVIKQKNQMYSNCKMVRISCESNEIVEEIGDGSEYKVYIHVSWLPNSDDALRSMTATAPEIIVESGVAIAPSRFISKMELFAPTKKDGKGSHISYNNTDERNSTSGDVYICYQRDESAADYCYSEKRDENRLQKVFLPVQFNIYLNDSCRYKNFQNISAMLMPLKGGGDIYHSPKKPMAEASIEVKGNLISVKLNEDWQNVIPESVVYGDREYHILAQFDFIVVKNNISYHIYAKAESFKEAKEGDTAIIDINMLKLRWGCLAEGTKILMADGSEKEIQNIKKGDLIVNSKGESIRVTELITGTEKYIYRAVTEGGRKVSASYNHPFVTEQGDGLLFGFDYQTKLLVKEGNQYVYDLLSYCYPEEYNGNVYSINVEGGENTVIADGFVTWTNDAVERIERETFVSEDAVLTSAEQEEFDRLKAWIENR